MGKSLRQIGLGLIVFCVLLLQQAQGNVVDAAANLYGRGVHAYFAGHVDEAESYLSHALGLKADDPRIFYFRALSRLRQGRREEACSDLSVGAAIEAERLNRYAVGAALQRVQGADRLLLERYRQLARAQAARADVQARTEHPQAIAGQDSAVLRQRVVVPLDEYLSEGVPRALTAEELARRAAAEPRPPKPAAPPPVAVETPRASPVEEPPRVESTQPAPETPPPPTEPTETPAESDEDPFLDFQ
jgi:hypothetical protein